MVKISLLSDVKFFLKKYLKNPVVVAAVAYITYITINKFLKKESLAESIKVIKKSGPKSIIFDDSTKKYILVDVGGNNIYSADKPDKLMRML